jgi:hypothetical protein
MATWKTNKKRENMKLNRKEVGFKDCSGWKWLRFVCGGDFWYNPSTLGTRMGHQELVM